MSLNSLFGDLAARLRSAEFLSHAAHPDHPTAFNRYEVSEHFEMTIADNALGFVRIQENIDAEAAVDGLYIVRCGRQPETDVIQPE